MSKSDGSANQLRLLKFLSAVGEVSFHPFGGGAEDRILVSSVSNRKQAQISSKETIEGIKKAQLAVGNELGLNLTAVGEAYLSRALSMLTESSQDRFLNQHRLIAKEDIQMEGVRQSVTMNCGESPLLRLKSKKGPNGSPWISDVQFVAGERLRADYSKAQLMPNITSNWDFSSRSSGKGRGGIKVELSDSALDARQRVETSLEFVGAELAGLLVDVCCFLKGLEIVEKERQWPARSAKLMLRTGLDLLARKEGLESSQMR